MAQNYRKKPVEIEAVRCVEPNFAEDIRDWVGPNCRIVESEQENAHRHLVLSTLAGERAAHYGDWIIRGVAGEFYPCRDDIFRATYEAV